MMDNGRRHRELMKSLAIVLVLLLTFGGMIPVFASTEVGDTQETVTQSVYDDDTGGGNEDEDFTILYTGVADVERYYHPSNTVCDENKIEDPTSGSVELGNTGKYFTYSVNGNNELTWSVDEGIHITAVSVKGGQQNAGFNYYYTEAVSGDSGLHANVKNNSPQGVSHISFCWDEVEEDEPSASLTILKDLFDEDDEMIEASYETFEVMINDSDNEEFWLGNISVDAGFNDDEMELGTYFVKENVDSEDFTVTYMMGETELTVDEDGFIRVDLDEDGDSVTIIIQNRPVADDDPESKSIELEIIKRIVQLDDDDNEADMDMEFIFEVTLSEDYMFDGIGEGDMLLSTMENPDTFAGLYTIHTGENGSDGKTHFFMGEPNLTPFYTVEETEINEEDGFSLLRYEVRFFDDDDNQIGDTDTETDASFLLDMSIHETIPSRVEITVFNLFTPEEEPEEPVEEPEEPEGDDPDDDDPADDPDETITVPDTTPPAGDAGTPAVETTVIEEPMVTIEETIVPLAAPEVEVEEPVIVLDEPIPLAPPVLPQTGDGNPMNYSLAGLLLMAVGFIFRKRMAA